MLFILIKEKLSALFPRTSSQTVKHKKVDSKVAENSLCCQVLRVVSADQSPFSGAPRSQHRCQYCLSLRSWLMAQSITSAILQRIQIGRSGWQSRWFCCHSEGLQWARKNWISWMCVPRLGGWQREKWETEKALRSEEKEVPYCKVAR